ncbi:MAG: hypothetical protein HXX12_06695 [Geothrix sp.]|uniref:hypothetical protein n=1 Tax=Geothrix sp. TaxID=1962974 RepID=UPI0017989604|nr:hypothetical protein [Geothrix sp.]NWJ40644.1 hypothetical protein [Geothrix sp.]WIL21347.1 MAG: hypothetical protein QOZ81_000606 [Geothrix sp.]
MRAWILGILLAIVGVALVLGLWLLGYHLSGRWAFQRWQTQRIAMGDRFGWKELAPPPVPPEQNFAEAPLIKGSIIEKGAVDARFNALALPKGADGILGNWMEGRRDDLDALSKIYGTADLQTVFKPMEAAFRDLDQATRRSGNRFPIAYEEGEIPALLGFRAAMRTLRVRAVTNLRAGRTDLALEDLQTGLRLADHLKAEPHLISALLRVAILNITLQVAWEGLEDHRWTASQLATLQGDLARIDLLATLQRAWQAERQFSIGGLMALAENQPRPASYAQAKPGEVRLGALGRGWVYRNLLESSRYLTMLVDVQDPQSHRVHPDRMISGEAWLKPLRYRYDLVLAKIALPALVGQVERFARTQALLDEGVVVCALERHRLDKGQYPERLEALAPAYLQALPHDLVSGEPLRYARKGEGFALYQVGWDGQDNDGTTAWTGEGRDRKLDPARGDWVWPHANR